MADLVSSIGIGELVDRLRAGEYLVPRFQREFVWTTADVTALLNSIIESHPIGMMTLWEQPDDSGLELEHISLPDEDAENGGTSYFGVNEHRTKKTYAILDGRQRSTAIAIAFGGLKAHTKKRQGGKFFLNVVSEDAAERIVFKTNSDVESQNLNVIANCISEGLFPFEFSGDPDGNVVDRWMRYQRDIIDRRFYKDGKLPDQEEIDRRVAILDEAVKGVTSTMLAIYIVPQRFDLGAICEIFETLNTTGTTVSTVDLIHSWLYSDTQSDKSPINLRDWIKELGQTDGGAGWASPDDRPELIAQFVTATYLLEKRPSPARKVGGRVQDVKSVKSSDLLATPTEHWKDVISKTDEFSSYLLDFQECVAKNRFGMISCPYPISAAIYIALRWANKVDSRGWKPDAINAVYRAFFWRNALNGRYDQGFLTKMATDLKMLEELLDALPEHGTFGEWAQYASRTLDQHEIPTRDKAALVANLLSKKPAGALGKALVLPVLTGPRRDLLDPTLSIEMGRSPEPVEVHHLFPRAWVQNNVLKVDMDEWRNDGKGMVECIANLTPMLRSSNATWKAKAPGKALTDAHVMPSTHLPVLRAHWLSDSIFDALTDQEDGLPRFWQLRASAIAEDLIQRMAVQA
ncbi:MAG: DUF262 domain-containing protein [Alphaproteobacteria bacterium]|nr:MAG: DUF262 domain-containing protein [Alphaproteobacteria bacterium]